MSEKWKVLTKDLQEKLREALALAGQLERVTGVPRSITVVQWAIESAWGRSELALNAHNYFGVKAGSGWKGEVYVKRTKEQTKDGKEYEVEAAFRKYASMEGCFEDRGAFLLRERYKPCFNYPPGTPAHERYRHFAKKLQECGYATDIRYADKLIESVQRYDLNWYDFPKSQK